MKPQISAKKLETSSSILFSIFISHFVSSVRTMAKDGKEYSDLVTLLNDKLSGEHHYVEILPEYWPLEPGTNFEVAHDKKADGSIEHTIGIPKKVLVKAFLTAKNTFFASLYDVEANKSELMASSMIILLFDPEYLTAANTRKRIILTYRGGPNLLHNLGHELWLTEFFLMSRLKRHNKSPTLWSHRKWLFRTFKNQIMGKAGYLMESEEFNTHEICALVFTSAEHHPRNYYAWDYLRWWVGEYAVELGFSTETYQKMTAGGSEQDTEKQKEKVLLELVQGWCVNHHADISGWAFYLWLLHRPHYSGEEGSLVKGYVGSHVLQFAARLGYRNESVWAFLREIARMNVGSEPMMGFASQYLQAMLDFKEKDKEGERFGKREIERYREWCQPSQERGIRERDK